MLQAEEHDPRSAWCVVASLDELAAAAAGGCRTVLVDRQNATRWFAALDLRPHAVAGNLGQAARMIISADGAVPPRAADG